jgi:hypothetical protein|tara:strand:- start:3506 stop:3817 length:312 start_codon:yes stop_codon:yes gene_type:complete
LRIVSILLVLVAAVALGFLTVPISGFAADMPQHNHAATSDLGPENPCDKADTLCCQPAHCSPMCLPASYESGLAVSPGWQRARPAATLVSALISGIDPPPKFA